jgi:cystathionine gamma-synthase
MPKLSTESWLVSAGRPDKPGAPLNTPPVPASNYLLGGDREYARDGSTPTWEALEAIIGSIEGGESVAFASGMGAAAAVFDLLDSGARVVLPDDCYQGVAHLAENGERRGRWKLERIAVEDTAAWLEAASILAVDNTFATPLNQQPLQRGADVSMHSVTKFIGGHSDLLAGIVSVRDPGLLGALRRSRTLGGATPGTLESWLAVRGARTLALRLERAQQNAGRLAAWLEGHPRVEKVRYPGLPGDPGHSIAAAQLSGFGSMISFDVAGGAGAADAVCRNIRLIRHASSLGAVESTMERRAANAGQEHLPPSLLRLSVGIESCDDLEADLDQALRRADG